jgi:putative transposase
MYNATLKYFKVLNMLKIKKIPSIIDLKAKLQNKKNIIVDNSLIKNEDKSYTINKHILDYAINDCLNKYKACVTNLKEKNIKSFRMRYIKLTKINKIIKIEKQSFTKDGFCVSVFNKIICDIKDFNYLEHIETVAIVTKRNNEYYLLTKHQVEKQQSNNKQSIGIDLGIRTGATCYTNKGIVEICTDSFKIKNKLKKIDNIKRRKFMKIKENKLINKYYTNLKNMIKDMHWKVSKYLTDNYKNIFIGNFSTKEMGEKNNVQKMTKRIGNSYSFFQFKQKLKYMCNKKDINYKEVDEAYTSQCCGKCSNQKTDLGSNKVYNCNICKLTIDRDTNSGRLILIAGLNK